MARTKGAKDKKPRKKRISIKQKTFTINLNSNQTSYVYANQRISLK